MPLGPGGIAEGDVGQPQRLLGRHEGRHLPTGQRSDAPGEVDRRRAGRIRRIAREGTHPVYRRQRDGDDPGHDHGKPFLGVESRCFFRSGHIRRKPPKRFPAKWTSGSPQKTR
jgi:hypothetical protein